MASFVLSKAKPWQQPRSVNVSFGYVQLGDMAVLCIYQWPEMVFVHTVSGVATRWIHCRPGLERELIFPCHTKTHSVR